MPNFALIPNAATVISVLADLVDGYPQGVHKLETVVGSEPLQDGRAASDHAVARQERLVLTGWVSDLNGGGRPAEAWAALRRLQKSVTPFPVLTEWGAYPEMIIRRAEAPKETRGMRFTLELEEIIRVGVTYFALPASQLAGPAVGRSGEVQRGRVPLDPPTPGTAL